MLQVLEIALLVCMVLSCIIIIFIALDTVGMQC